MGRFGFRAEFSGPVESLRLIGHSSSFWGFYQYSWVLNISACTGVAQWKRLSNAGLEGDGHFNANLHRQYLEKPRVLHKPPVKQKVFLSFSLGAKKDFWNSGEPRCEQYVFYTMKKLRESSFTADRRRTTNIFGYEKTERMDQAQSLPIAEDLSLQTGISQKKVIQDLRLRTYSRHSVRFLNELVSNPVHWWESFHRRKGFQPAKQQSILQVVSRRPRTSKRYHSDANSLAGQGCFVPWCYKTSLLWTRV